MRLLDFAERAACASVDTELFFPVTGWHAKQVAEAEAVCARCAVQRACRQWALEQGEHGIWGGTTESERDNERRVRPDLTRTVSTPVAA
jgi:WhiB family redox-sensing transcriptional regulator